MLPDHEIIAIHRARANNLSIRAISRMTRHSYDTVINHLSGRLTYPDSLEQKLARFRPALRHRISPSVPDGYLTLREAALLIPFSPSIHRVYDYTQARSLQTVPYQNRLLTTTAWLNRFIKEKFGPTPRGVFILQRDLDLAFIDDYDEVIDKLKPSAVRNKTIYRLAEVQEQADKCNVRFSLPPIVDSRVARALTFGTRFFVIHQRLWP